MKDGVIVQKTGPETLFVFPPTVQKPSGRITVGSTIDVMYFLNVTGGNARFIAMDAGTVRQFKPDLSVINKKGPSLGFYLKDTENPMLDVHIGSKFTREIHRKAVQQKIGREGNLKVSLGRSDHTKAKIIRVDIN